eukprot:m.472131 g.472131  ORF g.472131 m.472131 type:complete len:471 (+) comp20382_c0_seq1:122-1534(+)
MAAFGLLRFPVRSRARRAGLVSVFYLAAICMVGAVFLLLLLASAHIVSYEQQVSRDCVATLRGLRNTGRPPLTHEAVCAGRLLLGSPLVESAFQNARRNIRSHPETANGQDAAVEQTAVLRKRRQAQAAVVETKNTNSSSSSSSKQDRALVADRLPSKQQARVRNSKQPPKVVLVTQLDHGRLDRLSHLLTLWQGPMVAAVACRGPKAIQQVHRWLDEELPAHMRSWLTLHLVDVSGLLLFPFGVMRNAMLLGVPNNAWAFGLDADADPSATSSEFAAAMLEHADDLPADKAVVVVAALDAPQPGETRRYFMHERSNPTAYVGGIESMESWRTARKRSLLPYKLGFEGYFACRMPHCVPYQADFIGRGRNKAHVHLDMACQGIKMYLLPGMYVTDVGGHGVARENPFLAGEWERFLSETVLHCTEGPRKQALAALDGMRSTTGRLKAMWFALKHSAWLMGDRIYDLATSE